jgi:putative Holliday junction resolvase
MPLPESLVALDVGERRIGVAVSDPLGIMSLPYATVERTNVRADVDRIVEIAAERRATTIVVGDPLTLSGERALAAQRIDAFVAHLARAYDGTIARIDERLTTAAVQKALISADVSRKRRKAVVDQLAAALILDTYRGRQKK